MDRLVDVYAYHKAPQKIQLLILKRAAGVVYAGQWRMVGGKVHSGEKASEAALRELLEETSLYPPLLWSLPSVNIFYDPDADTVRHVPAFAAGVNPGDSIALNHEHSTWKWITESEISAYIPWPEQRRLMRLLVAIATHNKLLDEWIIHDQR